MRAEDAQTLTDFIQAQLTELRSLEFPQDTILWHYTTGDALISIIESGVLYATQVSCLNDSTEIRYSGGVLLDALKRVKAGGGLDREVEQLLDRMAAALTEQPEAPSNAPSPYFVTCFSEKGDDLSQWRAYSGGENGYAIGLRASGLFGDPNSLVVRVNYDKDQHRQVADRVVEATVRFYKAGQADAEAPEKWADEFLLEWTMRLSRLGPMVKDEGFRGENEYRMVRELQQRELGSIRFRQKKSVLSRHLPLTYPQPMAPRVTLLPLAEIKVGPSRHKELSAVSIRTLLAQVGYGGTVPVTLSKIPFQET